MTIEARQKQQFIDDGFLILENFVATDECDRLRDHVAELLTAFDPQEVISIFTTNEQSRVADDYFLTSGDKICFFFEENAFGPDKQLKQSKEQSINKIGHALHDLDPVFDKFSRSSKIAELVNELGVVDPLLVQSMYIFKQPNIGGEVGCHQDSTFLFTEPNDIVGLWFALEDATIENGCLWAIPGGHKSGLKSRWIRTANGMKFEVFDDSPWPEDQLVPLEVKKGSLIVLDGLLPHRSYENKSAKSRHAYTLHVIGGAAKYPEDNWLQRELPVKGF